MAAVEALGIFLLLMLSDSGSALVCHCDYLCPDDHKDFTCETEYKCFAVQVFLDGTLEKVHKYGCISPIGGEFICRTPNKIKHEVPNTLECCDDYDLCNYELEPTIKPEHEKEHREKWEQNNRNQTSSSSNSSYLALMITTSICVSAFIILVSYFYLRYRQIKAKRRLDTERQVFINNGTASITISELYTSTGTGSGTPALTVRSIAREITVLDEIGRGRFSVVHKGRWMHQIVAVKTVSQCDEISLTRELDMYKSGNINHENILNFIGADIINDLHNDGSILRWVITSYQSFGSLYDFLQTHSFDHRLLYRLSYSAVCGLHYIHRLILGTHGKPAIAHRDIKSKNMYVKDDLQCCIGDLGLAVKIDVETNELNFDHGQKLPTIRYMAPEVLVDERDFSLTLTAYQKSDIYSFGLVLWEILRRYEINESEALEYQAPFYDCVGDDPSMDDMKNLIVHSDERPTLPSNYEDDMHACVISKIMKECWYKESSSRLTALRIKKFLTKCVQNQDIVEVSGGSNSCNTASTGLS